MLQDIDEIELDFVDTRNDSVRIIEIPLFLEKSIQQNWGDQFWG